MSSGKADKIFRGTITNWQLHHLSYSQEEIDQRCEELGIEPALPLVITGVVDSDPTNRARAGSPIRTSMLAFLDEEAGYCETRESSYQLLGPRGSGNTPDLGDAVFSRFI